MKRLLSLDAFRGITIAGMILVNNPGSWSYIYPPLRHAAWHGCTPTDLVFPFFLFIVGVAVSLALPQQLEKGKSRKQVMGKVAGRSLTLFLLGLFLAGFPFFGAGEMEGLRRSAFLGVFVLLILVVLVREGLDSPGYADARSKLHRRIAGGMMLGLMVILLVLGWPYFDLTHIRIPGVLQRIALVYLAASALFLFTSIRTQWLVFGGLLLLYWIVMTFVPVPGHGPANLDPETNLGAWLDRLLLEGHLWSQSKTWDPEGLLSTLPAIATALMGIFAGRWIQVNRPPANRTVGLFLAGSLAMLLGLAWDLFFPINKQLWTSSYVLYTGGLALHFLAICYWFVDVKGYKKWAMPFVHYGSNAIVLFVLSGVVARALYLIQVPGAEGPVALKTWIMDTFFNSWLSPVNASLAAAITAVLLFWVPAYGMYKKRIFIKV